MGVNQDNIEGGSSANGNGNGKGANSNRDTTAEQRQGVVRDVGRTRRGEDSIGSRSRSVSGEPSLRTESVSISPKSPDRNDSDTKSWINKNLGENLDKEHVKAAFTKVTNMVPKEVTNTLSDYRPVLVILGVALLAAIVSVYRATEIPRFMPQFMGIALVIFAMLKLFDIRGFKSGFAEYDLVTMRWAQYGYWYPVVELTLGLGFLSGYLLGLFSFLTILVMSVTAVGVTLALMNKREIKCACTGTLIQVPLSSVSLIESVGMTLMAVAVLSRSL